MTIDEILKHLITASPGFALLIYFAWTKDRDNKALQEARVADNTAHQAKQESLLLDHRREVLALQTAHREEVKSLIERQIAQANTWIEKYHDRGDALQTAVQSLTEYVVSQKP